MTAQDERELEQTYFDRARECGRSEGTTWAT